MTVMSVWCVFWPAFGCCAHPKAGQTTFFQSFSSFFVNRQTQSDGYEWCLFLLEIFLIVGYFNPTLSIYHTFLSISSYFYTIYLDMNINIIRRANRERTSAINKWYWHLKIAIVTGQWPRPKYSLKIHERLKDQIRTKKNKQAAPWCRCKGYLTPVYRPL